VQSNQTVDIKINAVAFALFSPPLKSRGYFARLKLRLDND